MPKIPEIYFRSGDMIFDFSDMNKPNKLHNVLM
jgi:hypothetical protein